MDCMYGTGVFDLLKECGEKGSGRVWKGVEGRRFYEDRGVGTS
jgi:hypothetical protein